MRFALLLAAVAGIVLVTGCQTTKNTQFTAEQVRSVDHFLTAFLGTNRFDTNMVVLSDLLQSSRVATEEYRLLFDEVEVWHQRWPDEVPLSIAFPEGKRMAARFVRGSRTLEFFPNTTAKGNEVWFLNMCQLESGIRIAFVHDDGRFWFFSVHASEPRRIEFDGRWRICF